MDFIICLLDKIVYRWTYNAILMVVDKISKICHYIPCHSDMIADKLAKVITQESLWLHRLLLAIISDCGSLFPSRLLANLMDSFWIEQKLSIAFYLKPTNKPKGKIVFCNNIFKDMSMISRMIEYHSLQ